MSGSLDTNILLRLVVGDLPEQSLDIEKLLATGKTFQIADAAIFEMIYVLEKLYKMEREQVSKSVLAVIRNVQFNCNRQLFELVLPLYTEQPNLSIIDCALSQYAILNRAAPLYTFDKALAKAYPDTVHLLTTHV